MTIGIIGIAIRRVGITRIGTKRFGIMGIGMQTIDIMVASIRRIRISTAGIRTISISQQKNKLHKLLHLTFNNLDTRSTVTLAENKFLLTKYVWLNLWLVA